MDFLELVETRKSVRKFEDRKVNRNLLEKCVEAARLSPSACNAQPWKFVMIDEPDLVKKVAECTYNSVVRFNKFTDNAAAFAVVVMEPGNFKSKTGSIFSNTDYAKMDMGMAVEHFCLQAAELEIGTCILGWCRRSDLKKVIGIPV